MIHLFKLGIAIILGFLLRSIAFKFMMVLLFCGRNLPQLVKGGKNVYGWSVVSNTGKIPIPAEALREYNFNTPCKVILLPGSKRSGGFGITTLSILKDSIFLVQLNKYPELISFQIPDGEAIMIAGKPRCWVMLDKDGYITVPQKTRKNLGSGSKTTYFLLEEAALH